MTRQTGGARRLSAGLLVAFLLSIAAVAVPGTNWTAPVDPTLAPGDYALVSVRHGAARDIATVATSAGASDVRALDALDVVTARVSAEALRSLRASPQVSFIGADTIVNSVGTGDRYEKWLGKPSSAAWAVGAQRAWSTTTGRGVTVAVMDSGVANHPDLDGSVIARVDFIGGTTQLDPSGHGTFVAGLIAAHGPKFKGIAPDAKIVSLRVLDQTGFGTMHAVLAAFDWLLHNRVAYQIRVLNLSLGAPQAASYHKSLLSGLVESAHFAGIVVVAAAGNGGPNPGTVTSPGSDPFVLTAGSYDTNGTSLWSFDDRISSFSGRGPTLDGFVKPDVLAPGEHVVSLRVPAATMDTGTDPSDWKDEDDLQDAGYARLSGTSASSAITAGVAALMVQAHPAWSPTEVKGAIVAGSRALYASPTPTIDAAAAVQALPTPANMGVQPSAVLLFMLKQNGLVLGGGVGWEGISWEGISWELVSWEGIAWESASWETVAWETYTQEVR